MRGLGELHDVVDPGRVVALRGEHLARRRRAAGASCAGRGRAAPRAWAPARAARARPRRRAGSRRRRRGARRRVRGPDARVTFPAARPDWTGLAPLRSDADVRSFGRDRVSRDHVRRSVSVGEERTRGVPGAHAHDVREVRRRVAATSTRCTTTTRSRRQVGNPSVFGHGMLSMGLAARVVKDWFGPEAIRRLQVRFAKQVWPGDVLTCTAVVTGKREEDGEHLVDLDLTVANQDGVRRSPARPPPRSVADRGTARRPGRDRHRFRARHRPRVRAVLRAARARRSSSTTSASRSTGGAPTKTPRRRCARRSRRSAARRCRTTTRSATSTARGSIVQTAVDAFGTVDILVNNAGIVRDQTLLKMDEADFDAVIARAPEGHVQLHAPRGAES